MNSQQGYLVVRPGDILLSRNESEEDNSSPGYWNHTSVYAGAGIVVEAQMKPDAVIEAQWGEFWNRYPQIVILRLVDDDPEMAVKLAAEAKEMVGMPYRKLASLHIAFRRSRRRGSRGENCVSVVRKAFTAAVGHDPRWRIPDDVANDPHLRRTGSKGDELE